jgi:predicted nucleotidyltransferase component of viral defense system
MELIEIRRTILTGIASDDELVDLLVLKGGNALELVHHIGERASVDLDFSLATDFDDVEDAQERLFRAIGDRFDSLGYLVFDQTFVSRPSERERGTPWGGYNAEFKIISKEVARELGNDRERMQRQAEVSGPNQQRRFKIEISAFEVTDGKIEAEVDDYVCYVYSLEMIVAEKLRAICQQSPEYGRRRHPTPRARDFYDIHSAINEGGVDLAEPRIHDLVRAVGVDPVWWTLPE